MEKETQITSSDIGQKYAFVFSNIIWIDKYYYSKNSSTKYDDVLNVEELMNNDNHISEYLYSSITEVLSKYLSTTCETQRERYCSNKDKELKYISNLYSELELLNRNLLHELDDITK